MTKFLGKLFSVDVSNLNLENSWLKLLGNLTDLRVAFNIVFIMEVLFAQLTDVNGLQTQEAMKSELHSTGMNVLNSPPVKSFICALTIFDTINFTIEIKDTQISDQYKTLNGIEGARNSRFKGIIPSLSMSKDALLKYRVGLKFSIIGRMQSHPIYYSSGVSQLYGINLKEVSLSKLKEISFFPEKFDEAADFVSKKYDQKNPHYSNTAFEITTLQRDLGIYVENSQQRLDIDEFDLSSLSSEEEKDRARSINQQIKQMKKKNKK